MSCFKLPALKNIMVTEPFTKMFLQATYSYSYVQRNAQMFYDNKMEYKAK